jgi:hypothetical protein
MTYDPTSPFATQNLSTSQGIMLTNFSQLDTLYAIDHWAWDDATIVNRGMHDIINFPQVQVADPALSGGASPSNTFTRTILAKPQLFFKNGAAATDRYQITSDVTQWLPTVVGAGGGAYTYAPGAANAWWQKIGKSIFIWGYIRTGAISAPPGAGLPVALGGFSGVGAQPPTPTGSIVIPLIFNGNDDYAVTVPGQQYMPIFKQINGGAETIPVPIANVYVTFTGMYQ